MGVLLVGTDPAHRTSPNERLDLRVGDVGGAGRDLRLPQPAHQVVADLAVAGGRGRQRDGQSLTVSQSRQLRVMVAMMAQYLDVGTLCGMQDQWLARR
jgi:hypothetical protein